MSKLYWYKAKVQRVIDGDSVILDIDCGFKAWLRDERCRLAGIDDVLTKSLGTTNPLTLSRAAIDALSRLRSRREVEAIRGIAATGEVGNEA